LGCPPWRKKNREPCAVRQNIESSITDKRDARNLSLLLLGVDLGSLLVAILVLNVFIVDAHRLIDLGAESRIVGSAGATLA
jgi:hypothetical protein